MLDPVLASDGIVYDRRAIEKWMQVWFMPLFEDLACYMRAFEGLVWFMPLLEDLACYMRAFEDLV